MVPPFSQAPNSKYQCPFGDQGEQGVRIWDLSLVRLRIRDAPLYLPTDTPQQIAPKGRHEGHPQEATSVRCMRKRLTYRGEIDAT